MRSTHGISPKARIASLAVLVALTSGAATVSAQDPNQQPVYNDPMGQPQPTTYAAPPPAPAVVDMPRFRYGIDFAIGGESVPDAFGFKAFMIGGDLRLGLQLNDLIGIYVPFHLSFGSASDDTGATGFTGTFTAMGMVDFTLFDRLALGAGVGYGVLNNPSGPAIGFHFAGYPVMGRSVIDSRRRALAVGFDLRMIFTEAGTGIQYMASVGYEVF